jgi:2-hydroxyglutarate dehydrogenase
MKLRVNKAVKLKKVMRVSQNCNNNVKRNFTSSNVYDICIIGGGIVGLAVARALKLKYTDKQIILLEKGSEIANAQTGHNSGVVHAGMYYKSGSLKAKLCVEGSELAYKYFNEKSIPYKQVGKLIVAVNGSEVITLQEIYNRAIKNKVKDISYLHNNELIRQIEPHCKAIQAIHCKYTGIVDWQVVAKSFASDFVMEGGVIQVNHEVIDIKVNERKVNENNNNNEIIVINKNDTEIKCKNVISCTGIYSDRISFLTKNNNNNNNNNSKNINFKMIPFRGEYLLLSKEKSHLINGNIYPVPDLETPFLGVHFTPKLNGDVLIGPNALLSLSREGYRFLDFNYKDCKEQFTFIGLWIFFKKYYNTGFYELYKSFNLFKQLKELSKIVENITIFDLNQGPSGVRAQALTSSGELIEDFLFDESKKNILHVINAPSPAATASLSIANIIVEKAEKHFDL